MSSKDRFWSKVEKGESCWNWKASFGGTGYGQKYWNGRLHGAHRVAWLIENGEIPAGLQVLHHCDNRACVRPGHLFLGTQRDNLLDAVAKGRHVAFIGQGEANPRARLTESDVVEIRHLRRTGVSADSLADRFGLKPVTVRHIVSGRAWRHIPK